MPHVRCLLIAMLIATLSACKHDDPTLKPTPPDLTGWTKLPVEQLLIVREGELHRIEITTSTNSPGWTVDAVDWNYLTAPRNWNFELVGRAPESKQDTDVTRTTISKTVHFDFETRWIQVNGENGTFKALVPWLPDHGAN